MCSPRMISGSILKKAPRASVAGGTLRLKILFANDHALVREAISAMLEASGEMTVAAVVSVREAEEEIHHGGPFDLILLDYGMPGVRDLLELRRLLKRCKGHRIALLSDTVNDLVLSESLRLGAAGVVPKTHSAEAVLHAIRLMASGERYLPIDSTSHLLGDGFARRPIAETLTNRQLQTLAGISEGLSNKEIASRHDLKEVTVKLDVRTLCKKLGARNRTHAALIGRELGLS